VLSLAGLTDLVRADALGLGSDATRDLLRGNARAQPERYAAASPAGLLPLGVPVTLVHGREDDVVPVELSRHYAQRAVAHGDTVDLVELPETGHFELIDPLSGAWNSVLQALARLVS
jgi:pimeloyl-ACP methyl ester carboxylesterase